MTFLAHRTARAMVLSLLAAMLLVTGRGDKQLDLPAIQHVAQYSTKQCATDSSGSFKICLTQNYWARGQYDSEIKVEDYVVKVTRLDPSQLVQTPKFMIRMSTVGSCRAGCSGYPWQPNPREVTVSSPVSGQAYSIVPPWNNAWMFVATQGYHQCANATLTVKRYSSTWTQRTQNTCQGTTSVDLRSTEG